jgi:polyadenylate-binding protein
VLTRTNRFEDDDALRAKVNEAMVVYEEYMKTQKEPEAGDKVKEEKAEEKA